MVNAECAGAADWQTGSCVIFGSYWQNDGDDLGVQTEPIEWLVLENDGTTALLISKYGLDCQLFHHEMADIGWDACDLRRWLNTVFFNSAFSEEERERIAESSIYTGGNPIFSPKGCGETRDKVFILSLDEAASLFVSDDARKCQPTAYAVSRGAFNDSDNGCCWFWLRSPGLYPYFAALVLDDGLADSFGDYVSNASIAVRPALRVKAGTLNGRK